MNIAKRNAQRGFSVVELLIVVAIVGIVSTFALLEFRRPKVDIERRSIVRDFKVYLERARFDSVKRRADGAAGARITLNSPTSFTAALDFDGNGILHPAEARTVNFSNLSRTQIRVSNTLSYPITITFDRRGHVTTLDGTNNPVEPVFKICSDCTSASPQLSVISISTTGTVAMTSTEPDPSAYPTPPITPITSPTPTLNCYVYVGNTASMCAIQ